MSPIKISTSSFAVDVNRFFGGAAFSPEGKLLATTEGRTDASIRFWDTTSGKELGSGLRDHRVVVSGLVFWPDGKTLATSSFDQTIRLWDVSDPAHVQPRGRPLRGHASSVTALALLPDHQTLVSGGWDGSVLAWNTAQIRDRKDYVTLPGIRNWHFDADGKSALVLDQKGSVARWQGREFETKQPLLEIGSPRRGSFSEDGRFLAVGLTNGTVQLFDLDKRSLLRQFGRYGKPVGAAFVPGGKYMAVFVGNPPVVHVWDLLLDRRLALAPRQVAAVVNDAYQFQWGGGINDAGTLVWSAPANPSTPTWSIFEATWIVSPALTVVSGSAGLALEWPTNASAFHVQYATNLAPAAIWQRLSGTPTTNSGNFYQVIPQSIDRARFFRLSTSAP